MVLLAENEAAQKQRVRHWKIYEKELDQQERAQRIARTNQEIRRETRWFRLLHILIGVILGFGLAAWYFGAFDRPGEYAPVVEVNQ